MWAILLTSFSYSFCFFVLFGLVFWFFLFVFCFLSFYGHTCGIWEVSRLGVKSELQLPAYATATATLDLSRIWPTLQFTECWILNPLSRARDRTWVLMDLSWVRCPCGTTGTPRGFFFFFLTWAEGNLFFWHWSWTFTRKKCSKCFKDYEVRNFLLFYNIYSKHGNPWELIRLRTLPRPRGEEVFKPSIFSVNRLSVNQLLEAHKLPWEIRQLLFST